MAKYIIEIEDEPLTRQSALYGEDAVYRAHGFKSLVFDRNGLDKLIPFGVDGNYQAGVNDTQEKYEAIIKQVFDDKKADLEVAKREAYDRGYAQGKIQGEVDKREARKNVDLECLRCKQTYKYSWDTMDEISYTMYSYCPDCIRKGIQLLKSQDKEGAQE